MRPTTNERNEIAPPHVVNGFGEPARHETQGGLSFQSESHSHKPLQELRPLGRHSCPNRGIRGPLRQVAMERRTEPIAKNTMAFAAASSLEPPIKSSRFNSHRDAFFTLCASAE